MLGLLPVLSFCFIIVHNFAVLAVNSYNRSILQKKYPGFGTEFIPMIDDNTGEIIVGYFGHPDSDVKTLFSPPPEDVVMFTLYTREIPKGVNLTSLDILMGKFDENKPTKFITHGWLSSGSTSTCTLIKNGFLSKYDANVFVMDWSEISNNIFYPVVMKATSGVSEYYARFINRIVDDFGGNPKDFHLVGHSLGAHISGFAARNLKTPPARVTGLDPALPGFNNFEFVDEGRLSKNDADFVDVIHTCGGYLGLKDSIGHVDFYPNGGTPPQPGCDNIMKITEACSHGRSWRYFAESLNTSTPPFLANHCSSFDEFIRGQSCQEIGVAMGDSVPLTARGDYYLVTDADAPYAVGNNKVDKVVYDSVEYD